MRWQCRTAPSLGALEGTDDKVWGTKPYLDEYQSTCFFGLYGLPDFFKLWRHQGPKAILWAGTDIKHFGNGYWLDEEGRTRLEPMPLAEWINEHCDNYVENGVEHEALMVHGIESKIVPSFMGNVKDYEVCYQPAQRPSVYLSVSGDNFAMYGWEQVEIIADKCDVDFHLYGNTTPWESKHSNVFVHGRVPKEQMNEEIKGMQAALRTLEFDGCSEIIVKSVLWGQHPISRIAYPNVDTFTTNDELIKLLNDLGSKTEPNTQAREWFLDNLNRFPWNYAI